MNSFMIGMFGKYDIEKYRRDYRKDFYGLEVCLFNQEKDVDRLFFETVASGLKFGIHFPLRAWKTKLRDPQFLSADENVKAEAYKNITDELEYIKYKQLKPEYILFHYPKPVILSDNFDMSYWRFSDKSEYTYEQQFNFNEFIKSSEELFHWLTEKVLNTALNPYWNLMH